MFRMMSAQRKRAGNDQHQRNFEEDMYALYSVLLHMMTSSNGNISALLALCVGNSPVAGEFPSQRTVTRSFDVFL